MNAWIPGPVGVAWSVLFVVVLVVHVWHASVLGGRHRLWHLAHILMAAGMVSMFWPAGATMLVPAVAGEAIYLAAAGLLVVVVGRARGDTFGPLSLVSVADLGWMAYMFALTHTRLAWLSVAGAVWFAAQAAGWASGWLGRVLEHRGLGAGHRVSAPAHGGAEHRSEYGIGHGEDEELRSGSVDGGHRDWSVRVSLTVMGAGMAYMLLAMQFGMASMPEMPAVGGGMPGM